jgi:membrane protein
VSLPKTSEFVSTQHQHQLHLLFILFEYKIADMWNFNGLTWWQLLEKTYLQFKLKHLLDQSSKLAFYFLLSFFPFLLFLVALLGLFLHSETNFQATLYAYLTSVMPYSTTGLINTSLSEITRDSSGINFFLILLITWWTATHAMLALIEAINHCYNLRLTRSWWKKYLLAWGLTLAVIVLAAISIFILVFVPDNLHFLRWLVMLVFIITTLDTIYFHAPNFKQKRTCWPMPGTVFAVVIWFLATFGFRLYLFYFDRYAVIYGSIGVVIILLLWFYLTGVAFLTGAAINAEIDKASH